MRVACTRGCGCGHHLPRAGSVSYGKLAILQGCGSWSPGASLRWVTVPLLTALHTLQDQGAPTLDLGSKATFSKRNMQSFYLLLLAT